MSALDILIAIIALPTIFYIPGLVAFRAFNVHKIARLNLSTFESVFLQIIASIVITGWIALILAWAGCFSLWLLIVILEVSCFIVFVLFRSRFSLPRFSKPSFNLQSIFLILLIALAGYLFFRPFEDIWGYGDSYLYVNFGVIIANHGSIVIHDPLITSVPEDIARTFFFRDGSEFNCLAITNYSTGELHPNFLHLNAVWIAIFYLIFGLKGCLFVTPVFGLLAILSIYLVAKHVFNWKVAAIALSILTMSYLQIWFSRSHSAEILLQLLIFAGILTFVLFLKSKGKFFGITSALCLGLCLLTSIEATLIIIPIVAFFTFINLAGKFRKGHIYFIVPFVIALLFTLAYYVTIAKSYVFHSFLASDIPRIPLIILFSLIVIINVLPKISWKNSYTNLKVRVANHEKKVRLILILVFVAYLIYCLCTLNTTPAGFHGQNLTVLSLYMTPLVLVLGILGLILMIYKKPNKSTYFFLGVTMIFFLFFIPNIHHAWGGPWYMRRYIFAVIPMFCISAGYCVVVLSNFFSSSSRRSTPILLVSCILVSIVSTTAPIINHIENKGVIQQTEDIFGEFGDDSILLFADCSYPHIAYPLRHIYNKNALLLRRDYWGVIAEPKSAEDIDKIVQAYTIWTEAGKKVYVINPSTNFIQAFEGKLEFSFKRAGAINVPWLEPSSNFPTNFTSIVRQMRIYDVSFEW